MSVIEGLQCMCIARSGNTARSGVSRESPFCKMAAIDSQSVPRASANVERLCGFIVLIEEQQLSKVSPSRIPLFSYVPCSWEGYGATDGIVWYLYTYLVC